MTFLGFRGLLLHLRTDAGSRGTRFSAIEVGSSGLVAISPPHPRRMPTTVWPASATRLTAALMLGLSPGTSPPPVRMPMRMG